MNDSSCGYVSLHFGPMFSGKTGWALLEADAVATDWRKRGSDLIQYAKPVGDTRTGAIWSRMACVDRPCETVPEDPEKMIASLEALVRKKPILLVDEIQFLAAENPQRVIRVFTSAAAEGRVIILAGLDADYLGQPFAMTAALMMDPRVRKTHHTARCDVCNGLATLSQRLLHGSPAPSGMPRKVVEGEESEIAYEPRCFRCHVIPP